MVKTLKDFNKLLTNIKGNKKRYQIQVQEYLVSFIKEYETSLSKNSKPLQDLLQVSVLGNDIRIIKHYIKLISNIELNTNSKGNLTIKTTDNKPLSLNGNELKKAWYELKIKVTVIDSFENPQTVYKSFISFSNKVLKHKDKLPFNEDTYKFIDNLSKDLNKYISNN